MDQRLRLQAEVRDNASPKIRQIAKELKEVRRTPGMEAAQKWFTEFGAAASDFVKGGAGVASTIESMGVGGLTAAASLGLMVKQLKDLGDHTFAMKRLGQETGLTIDQINRWEYVGQIFRVPVEQMESALKTLGDQMQDFKRHRGDLFGQLNQRDNQFAAKLQLEDTQHQLEDIFGWLSKIQNAADRNRWAKMFFGTDELDSLLTNGLPALQKALKDAGGIAPISPDWQKKSDELNKSILDLNQSWQKFELTIGPAFLDTLNSIVEKATQFFNPDRTEAYKKQYEGGVEDERRRAGPQMTDEQAKKWLSGPPLPSAPPNSDGNALRRSDETSSPGLFHRSAFVTGLDDADSGLSSGVKQGVLAAFREWAGQNESPTSSGALVNAAYYPGGGSGLARGRGLGGSAGRGGPVGVGGADLAGGDQTGDHADFIREMAKKYGIDPRVAVAVANSEGLHSFTGDHGTSFGDFQLHIGGGLGDTFRRQTGLDPANPANWKAADEWALKYASRNGWGPWHGAARIGVTGMMGIGGRQAAGMPSAPGGASVPGHIGGTMQIGGKTYRFGSGGGGYSSIPFGDYPITPDTVGAWGRAHGALGINNNHIFDKALGRMRAGIELHASNSAALITEGCVAFESAQWPRVKSQVLEMVRKNGHAFLHVGKDGARITPERFPSLENEARKGAGPSSAPDGSIEAHVHIHEGRVRGVQARGTGVVKPPAVHLQRMPTMTNANIEA